MITITIDSGENYKLKGCLSIYPIFPVVSHSSSVAIGVSNSCISSQSDSTPKVVMGRACRKNKSVNQMLYKSKTITNSKSTTIHFHQQQTYHFLIEQKTMCCSNQLSFNVRSKTRFHCNTCVVWSYPYSIFHPTSLRCTAHFPNLQD